jgi:hypothetical protein
MICAMWIEHNDPVGKSSGQRQIMNDGADGSATLGDLA